MRPYDPPRSGDPASLGDYTIVGRLGDGGQGVVYLATDRTGARVAIKWLRFGDAVSAERFLREVRVAQQVAPFCTAQVLATGVEHDRPYIVSEYIEGPSLHHVVQEQGPRTGSALYRLAIGTATALAAIHEAGIVHRDFKPANVIIAPDGPRVIDFGIARALDATSTISSSPVGTPSFIAPEQLLGHQVGPAADLFAWASTIAYAASGRAPFGSDTMPAVINRILNGRPDVSDLDEPLAGVVHACLSKDPAQRPTAEEVIKRLIRHPMASGDMPREPTASKVSTRVFPGRGPPRRQSPEAVVPPPRGPAEPSQGTGQGWAPTAAQPRTSYPRLPRKRGKRLVVGFAAALTALLLVVVAVALSRSEVPTQGMAKQLPGTRSTLFERPDDPIRLASYDLKGKGTHAWENYARDTLTGPFRHYDGAAETQISPDGSLLARRGKNYTADQYDSIEITETRAGGQKTAVKTVKAPLESSLIAWSKDSSKILLNVEQAKDENAPNLGFVIVDVAAGKASVVMVVSENNRPFRWDGQNNGVVNLYGSDLRFFDAAGNKVRDAVNIGEVPDGVLDIFSPSGRTFATRCPDGEAGELCIWDSASGDRVRKVSSSCDKLLGWYDETHLYCWEFDNAPRDRIQVVDLDGDEVRTLLESPDDEDYGPTFIRVT
ncbi:serine/threonine protein kinase [Nonomuraea africana]|uniref:Serine/threonine protein kinase n=1 Tax=Nonomuraea africana TaxID=46171 RepID=A0ABR9KAG9_9ACTN|nr:serine/threonine-protein kinase [Nonomuraea africana]MBE1559008.1 serine/threonine protein kinase [Nonomuraea africana]